MSPTERWKAVMARDRRFDGAFVYAVRSTGIYCRPSCASRRPRRTQVTFFPIPEAAEREGFRACRRCHPADANGTDPAVTLVREACRAIAAGPGVCPVMIGESAAKLVTELRGELDAADVSEDQSGKLEGYVEAILSYLDGTEPHLDLPLDIRATAFQRRVWQELRQIPFGETRTYAEVAKAIGQPQATRAVARACATNPTALVIPCHRVVRGDGELGGYRWGGERKKALLEKERDVE